MGDMKDYFSVPEAAKICRVDRSTMFRWVKLGNIQFYTTSGGHNRILKEDLKKFLTESELPFDIKDFQSDKIKILIVDDDASVRKYLKQILTNIFIETEMASDGFEAGKKLIQFQPDLIILDLYMPNIDGFKLCSDVKQDPSTKEIKILALSGHGTQENKDRILSSGADAFLSKAASKKDILDCIEKLLTK